MTHPLTALIAGVPRFCNTSDALMAEDPMGAYVHWHDLIAALEAAPHVNETPKTEHDGADVLSATPPDLMEAGKVLVQTVNTAIDLSDQNMDVEAKAVGKAADTIRALIALAQAQAAQIAGLREANEKMGQLSLDDLGRAQEADMRREAAEAEAAALLAGVPLHTLDIDALLPGWTAVEIRSRRARTRWVVDLSRLVDEGEEFATGHDKDAARAYLIASLRALEEDGR